MEKGVFLKNGKTCIINENIFTTKKVANESVDLRFTPDGIVILHELIGTLCDCPGRTHSTSLQKKRRRKREDQESPIFPVRSLWSGRTGCGYNGEGKKKNGHPAPFPIELPVRCTKFFLSSEIRSSIRSCQRFNARCCIAV